MPEYEREIERSQVQSLEEKIKKLLIFLVSISDFSIGHINEVSKLIAEAADAGVDVEGWKVQLSRILKNKIREIFRRSQGEPYFPVYFPDKVERMLNMAADAGADVEDLKAQFPKLKKRILKARARNEVNLLQNQTHYNYFEEAEEAIAEAADAGVDVKDLKAQLSRILKNKIRKLFEFLQTDPGFLTHSPDQIERMLNMAADAGADVKDLKAQFSELKKRMLEARARNGVNLLRQSDAYYASFDNVEKMVKMAAAAGINVDDLLDQLSELKRKAMTDKEKNELMNK